jgi:hypothetical protein
MGPDKTDLVYNGQNMAVYNCEFLDTLDTKKMLWLEIYLK